MLTLDSGSEPRMTANLNLKIEVFIEVSIETSIIYTKKTSNVFEDIGGLHLVNISTLFQALNTDQLLFVQQIHPYVKQKS